MGFQYPAFQALFKPRFKEFRSLINFRARNILWQATSGLSASLCLKSASACTPSHLRTSPPSCSCSGLKLPRRWRAAPGRGSPRRIREPRGRRASSRWPSSSFWSTSSTSRRRGSRRRSFPRRCGTLSTAASRRTRVRGPIWPPSWWAPDSEFLHSNDLIVLKATENDISLGWVIPKYEFEWKRRRNSLRYKHFSCIKKWVRFDDVVVVAWPSDIIENPTYFLWDFIMLNVWGYNNLSSL